MKESQNGNMKGHVLLQLFGPDGVEKARRELDNLVVNAGLDNIVKQLCGAAGGGAQPGKMNYIGIGDDNTTPASGQTALVSELGTREQDTDPSFPGTGQVQLIVVFAAGNGTGTIVEAGVFDAVSSGTMFSRVIFGSISKAAGDALQITWTFTQS